MTDAGTELQLAAVLVALGLVAATSVTFTVALLRAGNKPHPAPLVVSLSLLSLLALAIGAAASSESAYAIAAAGVGALAGAVSSTFTRRDDPPDDEE